MHHRGNAESLKQEKNIKRAREKLLAFTRESE